MSLSIILLTLLNYIRALMPRKLFWKNMDSSARKELFRFILVIVCLAFIMKSSFSQDAKLLYTGKVVYSVSDIDGDQIADLICQDGASKLEIGYYKKGQYHVKIDKCLNLDSSMQIQHVAIGDIDNDNVTEIVIVNTNKIIVFEKMQNNYIIMDVSKTINISENQNHIQDSMYKAMLESKIREIEQQYVSVIVGDVNNDGANELLIAKMLGRATDYSCYCVDVFSWNKGTFSIITSTRPIAGAGEQGIAIFDLDGDGLNELLLADDFGSVYIYRCDEKEYKLYQIESYRGLIDFGNNVQGLRMAIGRKSNENKSLIAGCILSNTSGKDDEAGNILIYNLDKNVFSHINGLLHIAGQEWTIEEINKFRIPKELLGSSISSIRLPQNYSKKSRLFFADINNDQKDELILNFDDISNIYKIQE